MPQERMEKKIAIVSPNISSLGGISRCVIVLIEHLNKKGIIPDYYGIHSDKEEIYRLFNRKIDYNFKRIFWPKKAILYSSWMKNLQLGFKDYDYIFDFTNTLPGNEHWGNYFSYILYPEFLISRGKYSKGIWRIYYLPHQILAYLKKDWFANAGISMACVSKKTSNLIYHYSGKRWPVLYPPANLADFRNKIKKKKGVISVGGLTHEKNQEEQIKIARHFPKLSFTICGNSKRNPSYFKSLKEKILNVKNVRLYPDLPFKELKEKVKHAEIFLNSGREDPFCMALVEGISAGCIPLIHDSGGVTEAVPFKELRYKTEKEATQKLKNIINLPERQKEQLRKKLKKHIEQFSEEHFIRNLFTIVNHKVNKGHFPIGGKKYAS